MTVTKPTISDCIRLALQENPIGAKYRLTITALIKISMDPDLVFKDETKL